MLKLPGFFQVYTPLFASINWFALLDQIVYSLRSMLAIMASTTSNRWQWAIGLASLGLFLAHGDSINFFSFRFLGHNWWQPAAVAHVQSQLQMCTMYSIVNICKYQFKLSRLKQKKNLALFLSAYAHSLSNCVSRILPTIYCQLGYNKCTPI